MICPERVQELNDKNLARGEYVLYWMQQSQRAEYNHALEYAIERGNDLDQPVVVAFGLMDDYPEANLRHYTFMLEGLRETQAGLAKRKIEMVVKHGHPAEVALSLAKNASLVVCDRGYLRHQQEWRYRVAEEARCCVVQVESDIVVPVELVSDKAEFAARTIRPKIKRHLKNFLVELKPRKLNRASRCKLDGLDLSSLEKLLDSLKIDRSVSPVSEFFRGGTSAAKRRFRRFIKKQLGNYEKHRDQPHTDDTSRMSPYLHFGQISPLYLALQMQKAGEGKDQESFLEELIVRRELGMNYAHFNADYDSLDALPRWAKVTLNGHRDDPREHCYTREQLEAAQTHDPYWNAAMNEAKVTGYMHNYMRMYWGKKILEWSETPKQGFATTLAIMNKYFLDGRDPLSYSNTAWIYGLHDRPWFERPIFGKVRYMAASGLERNTDMPSYIEKVEALVRKAAA